MMWIRDYNSEVVEHHHAQGPEQSGSWTLAYMARTAFQGVYIGHVLSREHTIYNSKNHAMDNIEA